MADNLGKANFERRLMHYKNLEVRLRNGYCQILDHSGVRFMSGNLQRRTRWPGALHSMRIKILQVIVMGIKRTVVSKLERVGELCLCFLCRNAKRYEDATTRDKCHSKYLSYVEFH